MARMDNSAVTCNDFMSFEIWSNMASETTSADSEGSVFQVLKGVVYYVVRDMLLVVYCVVCVAAMPLPYTGKDTVLASTHNTKESGVLSGTAPQIIRSSVLNSAGWELNLLSVILAGNFPALKTYWVKVLRCSFWLATLFPGSLILPGKEVVWLGKKFEFSGWWVLQCILGFIGPVCVN